MDNQRRLMDMLAGWADFINSAEESHDLDPTAWEPPPGEFDAIWEMYQDSGTPSELTDTEIRAFILDRVVPFILTGAVC